MRLIFFRPLVLRYISQTEVLKQQQTNVVFTLLNEKHACYNCICIFFRGVSLLFCERDIMAGKKILSSSLKWVAALR